MAVLVEEPSMGASALIPDRVWVVCCSAKDCVIPAMGKGIVPTDLAIACPPGTYARIAPRSGLAVKHFIDTGAGVVDEDYRGAVGVVLFNHSQEDFKGEPYLACYRKYEGLNAIQPDLAESGVSCCAY